MSTAILVAGMHRSGTSATTGALRLAGVSLGKELLDPGQDNPKGYWENLRAVDIHEQLLAGLGRSWDDVRELPQGWTASTAAAVAMAKIHALIDEEFDGESLWAIKDPRICRFLPVWKRVLAERGIRAVVLVVARCPSEVAASIESRNGWPVPVGKLLWMRHVFEAEAESRDLPRTVVSYEQLLADPAASITGAIKRLGLGLSINGGLSARDLDNFVDPKDRHHVHSLASGLDETRIDAALSQAYVALAKVEASGEGWSGVAEAGTSAAQQLRESGQYIDAIAAMAAEWRSRSDSALADSAKQRSDLLAQIRWSEEAVLREQALHAELEAEKQRRSSSEERLILEASVIERIQQLWEWGSTAQASRGELAEALRLEQEKAAEHEELMARLSARLEEQNTACQRAEAAVALAVARSVELEAREGELTAAVSQLSEEVRAGNETNAELIEQARADASEAKLGMAGLQEELDAMKRSKSWRYTYPARALGSILKKLTSSPGV